MAQAEGVEQMGTQRKLTAGEIALAKTAFADKIDY
jgi:hypothetical protein